MHPVSADSPGYNWVADGCAEARIVDVVLKIDQRRGRRSGRRRLPHAPRWQGRCARRLHAGPAISADCA
eukprot:7245538-Pyramimonas_sp.AAC.1